MINSVLVFIIVLSILILVHELGHFLLARKLGVMVEEFGFGLPPRLIGKRIGETIYSINLFPFGGFVKLHGEDYGEKLKYPRRAFMRKGKKVRFVIVTAGVLMNLLLAIVSFGIVYSFSGIPRETKNVKVVEIETSSPAQVAGILVGDIVRKVDKKEVATVEEFVNSVEQKKGKKLELEIERTLPAKSTEVPGGIVKLTITPRENPPEGQGPLGVIITNTEIYYPPVILRPFYGIYYGSKEAYFWGENLVVALIQLFANLFKGKIPHDIAGPVGIFALTSKAAQYGILAVINFIGIMSMNLAILNIIPFPALDGGRVLFIVLERVIGKRVLPKIEATIHAVGMIILLLLLLAITAQDIQRLISAGGISGFLDNVLK